MSAASKGLPSVHPKHHNGDTSLAKAHMHSPEARPRSLCLPPPVGQRPTINLRFILDIQMPSPQSRVAFQVLEQSRALLAVSLAQHYKSASEQPWLWTKETVAPPTFVLYSSSLMPSTLLALMGKTSRCISYYGHIKTAGQNPL